MRGSSRGTRTDLGVVRINHDVIGRIAAIAAREVPGVAGVWEGLRLGGAAPWFGGVKVETLETELRIQLPIIVRYGVNLPRVAVQVQERVREAVQRMTDLNAIEVDVNIHGVREPQEGRP